MPRAPLRRHRHAAVVGSCRRSRRDSTILVFDKCDALEQDASFTHRCPPFDYYRFRRKKERFPGQRQVSTTLMPHALTLPDRQVIIDSVSRTSPGARKHLIVSARRLVDTRSSPGANAHAADADALRPMPPLTRFTQGLSNYD
jgi:hypothetical protein